MKLRAGKRTTVEGTTDAYFFFSKLPNNRSAVLMITAEIIGGRESGDKHEISIFDE